MGPSNDTEAGFFWWVWLCAWIVVSKHQRSETQTREVKFAAEDCLLEQKVISFERESARLGCQLVRWGTSLFIHIFFSCLSGVENWHLLALHLLLSLEEVFSQNCLISLDLNWLNHCLCSEKSMLTQLDFWGFEDMHFTWGISYVMLICLFEDM